MASATADSADATDAWSSAESSVASTWPVVTVSPAATLTAVTVPEEVKLRSSVCAAATVPSADTVAFIGPLVTSESSSVRVIAPVVVAAAAVSSGRIANHHTATATRATAGMITNG